MSRAMPSGPMPSRTMLTEVAVHRRTPHGGPLPSPGPRPVVEAGSAPVRRLRSVAPGVQRRDAPRRGARAARFDGVAGPRPVRGGCAGPAGAQRAVGRRPSQPGLRLTRRGRRLIAALSIAAGLVVAAVTGSVVIGGGGGGGLELAGQNSVVVEQGDTLWSIARTVAPERDARAVVDALEEVNHLSGTMRLPGQVLRLP